MNDTFLCAFRELKRRYLRTSANIAGYLCGSAFIVTVVLLMNLELHSKDQIINYMGTHFMVFSPAQYENDAFKDQTREPLDKLNEAFFAEPMVITNLLPINFVDQIRSVPEVLAATPFLLFRFKQGQNGHIFSVGGLNPADAAALKGTATTERDIISGAFFRPADRKVVLVDESYALMWNLKVGSVVNVADTLYPVIGIVRPGVRPVRADIYMNWPDAEEAINKRLNSPIHHEANIFLVESKGLAYHATAVKKVEGLLDGGIVSAFNCSVPGVEVMGISVQAIKLIVSIVFVMVLLFAANSQWASVFERQRDLAILKAIGWKNESVFKQIVAESFIQAFIGSTIGSIVGFVVFKFLSRGLGDFSSSGGSSINFVPITILLASFLGIGILAGLLPAIRAVKTRPSEVLRNN